MIRALPLLLLLLLFFTTSCVWLNSPLPSRRFDVQWDLQDPTHSQRHGRLFLTDDGLWGFQPEVQKNFTPQYSAGDLLWLKSKKSRHFFAVVQATSWSYRLQRLDDHPLEEGLIGDLHPVSAQNLSEIEGLCLISKDSSLQGACGATARHQRWHLFELNAAPDQPDDEPLRLRQDDSRGPVAPFERAGFGGADLLGSWIEESAGAITTSPLLAVLASPRVESSLQATLVVDEGCRGLELTSALVEPVIAKINASSASPHPLEIEALAAQHGADALIDCPNTSPRLLIPSLSRPMLKDDSGRFTGPPPIGLLPRSMPELSSQARNAWANAAALIAVGDATASAFWIEQALKELPRQNAIKDLALSALPILASAGLPELAMRYANLLTRGAWNPDNIPDFLETKLLLLGQFKMIKEQQEQLKRRQELAKSWRDTHRGAWLTWSAMRLGLAHGRTGYGPAFAPLIEELEEDEEEQWALTLWLTLAMSGLELPVVDEPAALQPRFDRAHAGELWRSITSDAPTGGCEDDEQHRCRLGSYGWIRATDTDEPARHDELLERLRRIAPIDNRRGFSLSQLVIPYRQMESPAQRAQFWLATSALAPNEQLQELTQRLTAELQEQMRRDSAQICDEIPLWQARFENAAARSRAPVLSSQRRQWTNLLDWWSSTGIKGLCHSASELLTAMESQKIAQNQWITTLFPLLQDRLLVDGAPLEQIADFERAAALARSAGDHRACTLWSLGVSVGAARRGLLELADRQLVAATNCARPDDDLAQIRNIVAAYIDFERAAGQNIIRDAQIDAALAQVTQRQVQDPKLCIGLLPLGFQLEDLLPETITKIADRIQHTPAPPEDFRLQTATHLIEEARSAFIVALRDLQRGHWKSAPRSLAAAHAAFLRLEHLPGLANIAFFDGLLFERQLLAIAQGSAEIPTDHNDSELLQRLKRGESHLLIDKLQGILELDEPDPQALHIFVAAMIINGRADELTRFTERLPQSLCSPPTLDEEFPLATSDPDDEEL